MTGLVLLPVDLLALLWRESTAVGLPAGLNLAIERGFTVVEAAGFTRGQVSN